MFVYFYELVLLRQQFQGGPLNRDWRVQDHISIAHKHRPRDFSIHRRDKAHGPGMKMESCGIALEVEIADRHRLGAEPDVSQLLVKRM